LKKNHTIQIALNLSWFTDPKTKKVKILNIMQPNLLIVHLQNNGLKKDSLALLFIQIFLGI